MISRFISVFTIVLVLAGFQTVAAQYSSRVVEVEPENVTVLYNNGNVSTGATTESGVAAPDGFTWSENQHDTGNTTEVNTALGFGATLAPTGNRLADNFTVPAGQTWTITSVSVLGFVSGWTTLQSPFSGATLQIWDGRPGDVGSNVVFGDTTTDCLISSTPSNIYVIRNTVVQPVTQGFTRPLWTNKLSVSPSLTLGPGTYWIDFQATSFNNAAVFFRNVVAAGVRTQNDWNARQYSIANNSWANILDTGAPSSAPDVPQDIAFEVSGFNAAPSGQTFMDFDGDGKTDFGVTRWGAAPSDPTEWFILKSGGSNGDYAYTQFGSRAGTHRIFSGAAIVDIVVPADYDGDGKTDIAVYRGGATAAAPQSYFYIMNSADNTIRIEQWGTRNDLANIMGDYDGDGKADLAVWRPGAQSTFYVRKSTDGGMIAVDWGISSDRQVLGDFDGDGKMDFSVARINSTTGESNLYTLRSSDGQYEIKPLPYPYLFIVPGDYDGDGITDIATINNKLNKFEWKINRSGDGITEIIEAGTYSLDFPAQGDYDGDGKTDIAVFRKTGTGSANQSSFWVRNQDGSYTVTQWGNGFDSSIATIRVY